VEVYVTATDELGNEGQSEIASVQVRAVPPAPAWESTVLLIAVALAVALAVGALIFLKRRKKESA
jgi:LPXTG-motif cell wall-anchored protein